MSPLSADQSEPGAQSCRDTVPVSLDSPLSLSLLTDCDGSATALLLLDLALSSLHLSPPDVIEAGTHTEQEQHLKSFDNIISS